MRKSCYNHAMANLQVKNLPEELHERLRAHARKRKTTMSETVITAVERELERAEWLERFEERAPIDIGVSGAELIMEARKERDAELDWRSSS